MNDEKLKLVFTSLNEDLPSGDFAARVRQRMQHRVRVRHVVLSVAAVLGLAIASSALLDGLLFASQVSTELVAELYETLERE
jgi:hypothetical protein